jgi:anti-sigma-K factor RskA
MTMDRHAEFADKLEAYALGQLSERETLEVESHLRECASCADEVRAINQVLEGIAESTPPMQPPSPLRQRVLAAVAEVPQDRARVSAPADMPPRSAWRMVPLAAAAVLVLAVGVVAIRVERSRQELAGEVTRMQGINQELQERLKRFGGQTDLAISILTSADTREIPRTGDDNSAAARAFVSPTRGVLVVADRLPVLPPGRVYQVWIIEDGSTPVSAGLLGDEPRGRGMLIATPPRKNAGGGVTVAISDEPPGGLDQPTGTIRVIGSI